MIKKFLSALLAVLMVVSMVPLAAMAEETAADKTNVRQAVEAKLHDTKESDPYTDEQLNVDGYKVTATKNETDSTDGVTVYDVTLAHPALLKHDNARKTNGAWIGFGVPAGTLGDSNKYYADGSAFYYGLGDVPTDYKTAGYLANPNDTTTKGYVAGGYLSSQSVTENGEKYINRYWDVSSIFTDNSNNKGFLVVKDPVEATEDQPKSGEMTWTYRIYKVTFNVTEGHLVKCETPANGTVEIKNGDATVTPGTTPVGKGSTLTITPKPATGYEIDTVKVGDQAITPAEGKYTTTVADKDVEIVVTFKADPNKIGVVPANLTGFTENPYKPQGSSADTYTAALTGDKEITVTATGLKQTKNSKDEYAYWVGVGLTHQEGATYAWDFGIAPVPALGGRIADEKYKEPDDHQTANGVQYDTLYWGTKDTDKWENDTGKNTGYISVKVGEEVTAEYTVIFDVKTKQPEITAVGYRDDAAKANGQISKDLSDAKGQSASITDSDKMTMWVVMKDLMVQSSEKDKDYQVVVNGPDGNIVELKSDLAAGSSQDGPCTSVGTPTGCLALYWTFNPDATGGTAVKNSIMAGEYSFQLQRVRNTGDSILFRENIGVPTKLKLAELTVNNGSEEKNYYVDVNSKKTLAELGISISDPTPADGKVFMDWKVGDEEEIIDSTALGSKVITKDTTVVAHLQEKQTAGFACGFEWNGDDANKAINDAIKVAGKTEKNISDCIDQTYWLLVNEDMSSTDTKHAYEIKKGETVLQQGTITGGSGKTGVVYFSFMGSGHNSQNVSVKEGDQLTFVLYPSDDKSAEAETKPFTIPANPLSIASAEVTSIAEKKVNVKFSEDLYGRYVIEVKKDDEVYATASTECDRGNGDAGKINKGEGITLTANKPFSSGEYTAAIRPNITGAPDIATKAFNVTVSTDATIKSVEIGAAAIGDIPAAGTLAAPAEIKATFPANEELTGQTVKLTLNDPTATVKTATAAKSAAVPEDSAYSTTATVNTTTGAVSDITVDFSTNVLYIRVTAQDGTTNAFYKVTAETSEIAVAPIPAPVPTVSEELESLPSADVAAVNTADTNTNVANDSKGTLTGSALAAVEKDETKTQEDANAAIDAADGLTLSEGQNALIYVVPSMKVEATKYEKDSSDAVTSYTVDITPMQFLHTLCHRGNLCIYNKTSHLPFKILLI